MDKTLLEMRGLRILFNSEEGYLPAVDGIDLEIAPGEAVGLVGESGCGKSVTASALMGLLPEQGCRVSFDRYRFGGKDYDPAALRKARELRGGRIGMVFQDALAALDPVFTVGDQLCEAVLAHRSVSRDRARREAVELLDEAGIPDPEARLEDYPHQLSGGMRQRVMIAMALINRPELLIADEPTTALDVTIQAQILRLIRKLRRREGMAVLFISHDLGVVAEVVDRVVVAYAGLAVEEAPVAVLAAGPKHPYSAGLLASIPALYGELKPLQSIPGRVPEPAELAALAGCRFAGRCNRVMERCRTEEPPLISAGTGHRVRCWLYDQPKDGA